MELTDYLKDQLDRETAAAVQKHLGKCRNCSEEATFLQDYLDSLSGLTPKEAPADFEAKVRRGLARPRLIAKVSSRPFKLKSFGRPALAGLVTALTIILAVNYFKVNLPQPKLAQKLSETKPSPVEAPIRDKAELNKGAEPILKSENAPVKSNTKSSTNVINQNVLALTVSIAKTMAPPMADSARTYTSKAVKSIESSKAEPEVIDVDPLTKIKEIVASMNGEIISQSDEANQYQLIEVNIPGPNLEEFVLKLKEIGEVTFESEQLPATADSLRIKLKLHE